MGEHREDDDFQKQIMLIDGVRDQYKDIHHKIIPISSYITARPDNVRNGTRIRLEKNDFPNHHRIVLRPQGLDHTLSNLWKACVLDILYPYVNGIVDDNPNLRVNRKNGMLLFISKVNPKSNKRGQSILSYSFMFVNTFVS